MTTIREIIAFCRKIAPFELADEWDNIGLLVGAEDTVISKVLLALDITPEAVWEAHEIGAQLIISHHPVIFEPLRTLEPDHPAYLLAKHDIAALCLHTDLDRAEQGVNTALARALNLKNTAFYPADYILVGEPEKPMDSDAFAAFIKARLNAPSVRYTDGSVTRVALSSGGGGEGVMLAAQFGFDAFITGELKHHQYIWAKSHGIAAFDAGHFSTENVVIKPLCDMLTEQFPDISFIIGNQACPYRAI